MTYTPFADNDPMTAVALNSRFAEMEASIAATPGAMIARTAWTTMMADAASITIDVVGGDNTLLLMACLRTDRAANAIDSVFVTINDDVVSTYTVRYGYFDGGASYTSIDDSGTTGFPLGAAATAVNAVTGRYGYLVLEIPLASSASPKPCLFQSISDASYPAFASGAGFYPVSAAVTRLKMVPRYGTVFLTGSRYALFGMG